MKPNKGRDKFILWLWGVIIAAITLSAIALTVVVKAAEGGAL